MLTAEQLGELRAISTPTLCNAIETFGVRPRDRGFMDHTIVCRFPELGPMVGYAVTAQIRSGRPDGKEVAYREVWDEFEKIPRPWVVVIEDLDHYRPAGSFWGEVNAATYAALGAVGAVTNGGVRDLAEVRRSGFHFFSSCVLVSHAYVHVVAVGTPVNVGGLIVRPGDLLHGDEHGVTSVPLDVAASLPSRCAEIEKAERELIDYARSGVATRQGLEERYGRVD